MNVQLGLGLIGIGKPWGYRPAEVPGEAEAQRFLEQAWRLGIRYFDTAASYGASEERLGRFLKRLGAAERAGLTIATKFGEHWDPATQAPYVDHSYAALKASLDRSLERLGAIDVLQLHKTTPAVMRGEDLVRAWEYAASCGIAVTGPSVSDEESAWMAIADGYRMMQLPFNLENARFGAAIERAAAGGVRIAVNRPFAMGKVLYDGDAPRPLSRMVEAFRFILARRFDGVILSGTRSAAHLEENLGAFREATGTIRLQGSDHAAG
jgi:aryl-alcohol dehydrogenase-like predicted oxidoreductase